MAMFKLQLLGLILSLISGAFWVAALTLHVRRTQDVASYVMCGIIGLAVTVVGVAGLDGGGTWAVMGFTTMMIGFFAIVFEVKAAKDLEQRRQKSATANDTIGRD